MFFCFAWHLIVYYVSILCPRVDGGLGFSQNILTYSGALCASISLEYMPRSELLDHGYTNIQLLKQLLQYIYQLTLESAIWVILIKLKLTWLGLIFASCMNLNVLFSLINKNGKYLVCLLVHVHLQFCGGPVSVFFAHFSVMSFSCWLVEFLYIFLTLIYYCYEFCKYLLIVYSLALMCLEMYISSKLTIYNITTYFLLQFIFYGLLCFQFKNFLKQHQEAINLYFQNIFHLYFLHQKFWSFRTFKRVAFCLVWGKWSNFLCPFLFFFVGFI